VEDTQDRVYHAGEVLVQKGSDPELMRHNIATVAPW